MAYYYYSNSTGFHYGKREIEEENVAERVKEIYKRMDSRCGFKSDRINVVYSSESETYTDEDGCQYSVLGNCSRLSEADGNLEITIFPDALNNTEVFLDTIKHEYSHAIAEVVWFGDEYYESHSAHGRRWQEIAKYVGCNAVPYATKIVGRSFEYAVKDIAKNKVLAHFLNLEEAECFVDNQVQGGNTNDNLTVVPAEEVYNDYLSEKQKAKEERISKAIEKVRAEQELKTQKLRKKQEELKLQEERRAEAAAAEAKTIAALSSILASYPELKVVHNSFGPGTVTSVDGSHISIAFDSGKTSVFSVKVLIEGGFITFPKNPALLVQLSEYVKAA